MEGATALHQGLGGDWYGDFRWPARRHTCKPSARYPNDCERLPLYMNLLSDNIRHSVEVLPPELISQHGHLRCCAALRICVLGSEQSSKERSNAKLGVIITSCCQHIVLRQHTIHFHIDQCAPAPADQTGANPLPAFDLAKHRKRERGLVVTPNCGELDKLLRLPDGEVTKKQRVDQCEYSSVRANAQRKREQCDSSEGAIRGQGADGVTQILPENSH